MRTRAEHEPERDGAEAARPAAVARTPVEAVLRAQEGAGNQATVRMLTREGGATATADQASGTDAAVGEERAPDEAAAALRASGDAGLGEQITITDELLALLRGGNTGEPPPLSKHKKSGTTEFKGQVTAGGARVDDVEQGALGDCYLLAALAAIAKANPALIEKMVKDNGDGTYDVTLYQDKAWFSKDLQPTVVKVTASVPTDTAGDPLYAQLGSRDAKGPALWVMLIEKAYAKLKGSYGSIEGGFGGPAMEALTGLSSARYTLSDYDDTKLAAKLDELLKANYAVTAAADWAWFTSTEEKAKKDVGAILNHEYTVVGVDASAKTVDLRNPWGEESLTALPMAKFKQYFRFIDANPATAK